MIFTNKYVEINKNNGFFYLSDIGEIDHSTLSNLDYLSSGHTGFAGIEFGTTAHWNTVPTYVPPSGMIVVYSDYSVDEEGKIIPGLKIGDGNAYLVDLAFIGNDAKEAIEQHIADTVSHITQEEREKWNNKLNYDEPTGGSDLLVLTRN